MQLIRMFTGPDEKTHFEDLELRFPVVTEKWRYLDLRGIRGARLHVNADDNLDAGFHNAPRRQLVLYLSGARELISGTGERRVAEPGTVVLAEDLTGEGHRTRCLRNPQQLLLLPLDPAMGVDEIVGGGQQDA